MDSLLVNPPVSSPLHPQLNLPLLKGYLARHGFESKVVDANIRFYHEFLGGDCPRLGPSECDENPLVLLSYYNDLEARLWEKSKSYKGLQVGLRSLGMSYDRVFFNSVLSALTDPEANPFIAFWERFIASEILETPPPIIGIAITFQDQLIPAFTLAERLRALVPGTVIVMGGQMITRCYESIFEHAGILSYADYFVLWDGEKPFLDIHRALLGGGETDLTNVIDVRAARLSPERGAAYPKGREMPSPDFSDLDFSDYLFPEMLVPLQTTRGCYAKCAFCAIPFGSNAYSVRDADQVIDDILAVQELTEGQNGTKATYFKFMEDTSSPSLLYELSARIEERGIEAKWETFARLEQAFTKKGFMEQLYRGGCRKIHWGLESNDADILATMNKKTPASYTDHILRLSADAGIMNFCFVLVGFPGETEKIRENLVEYIVGNHDIHTLTISTFDLTRKSPMEQDFHQHNAYGLDMAAARDFQVRLPYTVNGEDWKREIVPAAHGVMIDIIRRRPDIGFVTLFPDQIRSMFCDKYGNDWGRTFVVQYGEENIREMLVNTEAYVKAFNGNSEIDPASLPEPLRREHLRTQEDMNLLATAVLRRKDYEKRRIEQV